MIFIFSYNKVKTEQKDIETACRYEVARKTDDSVKFYKCFNVNDLESLDLDKMLINIIYFEIINSNDLDKLLFLRKRERAALLVLLSEKSVSPIKYLKPGISPDLLLLRPYSNKELKEVCDELFNAFLETRESGTDATITISSEGEKFIIPYNKIYYFVAENKKINLIIDGIEHSFYDTIDNLEKTLPDYFIRTHRAYLVNRKKITGFKLSEGSIYLGNEISIPLSRNYKDAFKGKL